MDTVELKLSLQRALLGEVTNKLFAVTAGLTDSCITVAAYYDGEPNDDDREQMEVVATEVVADFPEANDIRVEVYNKRRKRPEMLDFWAFYKADDHSAKRRPVKSEQITL